MRLCLRVYNDYLHAMACFAHEGSPVGGMLERMRLGTQGVSSGASPDQAARQIDMLNELIYCVGLLSDVERRVVHWMSVPMPHTISCAQAKGDRCDCGAVNHYERIRRSGDVYRIERVGDETLHETREGERYAGPVRDTENEVVEEWVYVEGSKVVKLTTELVARLIGITQSQVKEALRRADRKLEARCGS